MFSFFKKLFEDEKGGTVKNIEFTPCYFPPIRKEIMLIKDLAETMNIGLELKDKSLAINQYNLIIKHCESEIEKLKKEYGKD